MSDEGVTPASTTMREPEPTRGLELGRLEKLQQWAQAGATVALVLTIASIVYASYVLAGLNRELGEKTTRLKLVDAELIKKEDALKGKDEQLKVKQAEVAQATAATSSLSKALDNPSDAAAASALPARVYIQITSDGQRLRAREVQTQLRAQGFIVPGIENVAGKSAPQARSDVRFYSDGPAAAQDVEKIRAVLQQHFSVTLKEIALPKSSRARPRHYELWLGKDFDGP
jgi:hypothetical protein